VDLVYLNTGPWLTVGRALNRETKALDDKQQVIKSEISWFITPCHAFEIHDLVFPLTHFHEVHTLLQHSSKWQIQDLNSGSQPGPTFLNNLEWFYWMGQQLREKGSYVTPSPAMLLKAGTVRYAAHCVFTWKEHLLCATQRWAADKPCVCQPECVLNSMVPHTKTGAIARGRALFRVDPS
jgi:hypothetical protein